jgi:hypothetical protein
MAPKHLRHFLIEWSPEGLGLGRTSTGRFTEEAQQVVTHVDHERRRTVVLDAYISEALRTAKVTVGNPPIEYARVVLSAEDRPAPYFDPPPFLHVDVPINPLALLDLPRDREVRGEFHIRIFEEALARLEGIAGFPTQVIREACAQFRASDYSLRFRAGERMIPGTGIKGRVDVAVSAAGTIRYLTVLHRGQTLFRTAIAESDETELTFSRHFAGFARNGTVVRVIGGHQSPISDAFLVPSVDIDFAAFPEALSLMREKAWPATQGFQISATEVDEIDRDMVWIARDTGQPVQEVVLEVSRKFGAGFAEALDIFNAKLARLSRVVPIGLYRSGTVSGAPEPLGTMSVRMGDVMSRDGQRMAPPFVELFRTDSGDGEQAFDAFFTAHGAPGWATEGAPRARRP